MKRLASIALCLCLWLPPGAPSARAQVEDSHYRIVILGEADTASRTLLRQAIACEEAVRRVVNRPSVMPLYLLPDIERQYFRYNFLFYGLNSETDPVKQTHALVRAGLYRAACELNPDNRRIPTSAVPAWLVAAVHHQLLQPDDAASRHVYVGPRLLAQADRIPAWQKLVDLPPDPAQPLFYLLQAEADAALLTLCRRQERRFVDRLLEHLDPEQPPSAAIAALLPTPFAGNDSQAWFEDALRKLAFRLDQTGSYDYVRQQLRDIEMVSIAVPGDGGAYGIRKVHLEDVPQYLDRYDYKRHNVDAMIRDVFSLMQNCPVVLRQSLAMYVEALDALRQGNIRAFTTQIKAARARFNADYDFGTRVVAYLEDVELQHESPAKRLFRYLNEHAPAPEMPSFRRDVADYLDALEQRRPAAPSPGGQNKKVE